MASGSFSLSSVEHNDSREQWNDGQSHDITKPQPLRIVKKTVTGSYASREVSVVRRRGASGSSDYSQGTPTLGSERPLTVHKKRHGRESVLSRSFDIGPPASSNRSAISDLIKKNAERAPILDDPDGTPKKRKPVARTMSAGRFHKSQAHGSKSDTQAGLYSVRGHRQNITLSDLDYQFQRYNEEENTAEAPITQRRFSKSKNFLLRAFAGRAAEQPKPVRRTGSTTSKNTLIRRLSRSRKSSSSSYDSGFEGSAVYADASSSLPLSSLDIADVSINSRISSYEAHSNSSSSSSTSYATSPNMLILCPLITVTPELPSVGGGNCSLWVAIQVSGVLRGADGYVDRKLAVRRCPLTELSLYGRLHSMRIDLLPGQGCVISEIIGNLHGSKEIRAKETFLVLAKVRLTNLAPLPSPRGRESSSDEVMADLETKLSHSLCPYLTVRLAYKHSGFQNHKSPALISAGMSSHTTRLQTEATAVIKRHDPDSVWSPRASRTMNAPFEPNPLIELVQTHFSPEKARDVLRKLSNGRNPIPPYTRSGHHVGGSSEETVKPSNHTISGGIDSAMSSSLVNGKWTDNTVGPFAGLPNAPYTEEVDPARKIWTEMRRNSRSHRYMRTSISTDHYFSTMSDTDMDNERTPTRASSGDNSVSTHSSGNLERDNIREVALRNKRSVGTETLRSIAPSVLGSIGKGKGTVNGIGLGLGRSLGWGPPWW